MFTGMVHVYMCTGKARCYAKDLVTTYFQNNMCIFGNSWLIENIKDHRNQTLNTQIRYVSQETNIYGCKMNTYGIQITYDGIVPSPPRDIYCKLASRSFFSLSIL